MSNTTTDSNSNPIGIPPSPNVTVSTVTLDVLGDVPHKVLAVARFSSDYSGAAGGIIVAGILVDGILSLDTAPDLVGVEKLNHFDHLQAALR